MQIDNAALVHAAVQLVNIVGELDTMLGNHIRGSRGRGGSIVAVLGHLIACTCDHKARGGGDVEGVLAVASRAHHINVTVAVQGDGDPRL